MKDTGSVRIYRQADEMGAEIFSTPSKTQLNTIKKMLNPDGGDFFIDTPNSMGGGFHYEDIEDGMRQVRELLKSNISPTQPKGVDFILKNILKK
jgi:hypothetical protein